MNKDDLITTLLQILSAIVQDGSISLPVEQVKAADAGRVEFYFDPSGKILVVENREG